MRPLPETPLGLYSGFFYALNYAGELIFTKVPAGLNIAESRSLATRCTAFAHEVKWELSDPEPDADLIDSIKSFSAQKYGW